MLAAAMVQQKLLPTSTATVFPPSLTVRGSLCSAWNYFYSAYIKFRRFLFKEEQLKLKVEIGFVFLFTRDILFSELIEKYVMIQ